MKAALRIETARLALRPPETADARAMFERYSSDAVVTRFLGWPRHRTMEDACAFVRFSAAQWQRWPAGPYLVFSRDHGGLLGSTGLAFQTLQRATTGYVLAQDAWNQGYATEALAAMVAVARNTGVAHLLALCHPEHGASQNVLKKNGFMPGEPPTQAAAFPNLAPGLLQDALGFVLQLRVDHAPPNGNGKQCRTA